MNRTRLLRLSEHKRKQYIEGELSGMSIQTLRHVASEYGLQNINQMGKENLVSELATGIMAWAESELMVNS